MARILSVVSVVAALAVACAADEPVIDADQFRSAVTEALAEFGATDPACPAPLDLEPRTLDCTAQVGGTEVAVEVDVHVDPDISPLVALVDVRVDAPLLDLRAVEQESAIVLRNDFGGAPKVTCPYPTVVIEVGREIECRLSDDVDEVPEQLTIRVLDADGTWEMDLFE